MTAQAVGLPHFLCAYVNSVFDAGEAETISKSGAGVSVRSNPTAKLFEKETFNVSSAQHLKKSFHNLSENWKNRVSSYNLRH